MAMVISGNMNRYSVQAAAASAAAQRNTSPMQRLQPGTRVNSAQDDTVGRAIEDRLASAISSKRVGTAQDSAAQQGNANVLEAQLSTVGLGAVSQTGETATSSNGTQGSPMGGGRAIGAYQKNMMVGNMLPPTESDDLSAWIKETRAMQEEAIAPLMKHLEEKVAFLQTQTNLI